MTTDILSQCSILRCPISRGSVTLVRPDELASINDAIATGTLLHANGSHIGLKLTQGLGSHDRRYLYRLEDGICWLLPALAIVRPEDANVPDLDPNRQIVQKFYEEFGWIKNNAGFYNDTSTFVDVRSTSQQYDSMCNSRIAKQLRSGTYLLDAASGAIPHESYIAFSKDYKFRVCLDFSIRALREAKRKLGDLGVYVLGDMTNLPIASDSIDDAVSLHTIYHVPAAEQAGAIAELVRVVRPGGRVVIVSMWDKSVLMDWVFRTRRALDIVKGTIVGSKQSVAAKPLNGEAPPLYGAPQTYRWFVENVRDPYHAELRLWSATSPGFHKMCFSDTAGGRLMAHLVLKIENALEPLAARFGQYPMFVISKT